MGIRILALDLEATLISDAMVPYPRPGLWDFLTFCTRNFERIVLFTCVASDDAEEVIQDLTGKGEIPPEFANRLEYLDWHGSHKDLTFITEEIETVVLVDDDPNWVKTDQRSRWIPIQPWFSGADGELVRIRNLLCGMLSE